MSLSALTKLETIIVGQNHYILHRKKDVKGNSHRLRMTILSQGGTGPQKIMKRDRIYKMI